MWHQWLILLCYSVYQIVNVNGVNIINVTKANEYYGNTTGIICPNNDDCEILCTNTQSCALTTITCPTSDQFYCILECQGFFSYLFILFSLYFVCHFF